MKRILFFILSTGIFMACDNKNKMAEGDAYTVIISETIEEDDVGPPEPDFSSRFKTLQEWLTSICNANEPEKPIAVYNFSLFEEENNYILCLTGTNTYQ